MDEIFERFIVADPYRIALRVELYTQLLNLPDPPDLPPRRRRVIYPFPVNREALLVWLHSAHTQHRLLDARGEAA